jgi:cell division protein FtsQ
VVEAECAGSADSGVGRFHQLGRDWVRDPNNMPLRSVQVEGEFRKLSAEHLQHAVANAVRGGFFTVNVDAVRRAAESLPWVASARVRRVWPDALQLHVVEQRAAARWGEAGLKCPRSLRRT